MATLAEVLRQAGYVTPQGQVVGPRTTTAQTMSNYIRNIIPNAAQNLAQQRSDIDAALTMGDQGIQISDRAAFERSLEQVPNLMGSVAKLPTAERMKIAQANAALPVEQGGLGLPINNTAADRAKAMGYDIPVYHGTNADIAAFNTEGKGKTSGAGAFFTTNPITAETYVSASGDGNIMPLLLNKDNFLSVNARNRNWADIWTNQLAPKINEKRAKLEKLELQPNTATSTDELGGIANFLGLKGAEVKNVKDLGPNSHVLRMKEYINEKYGFMPKDLLRDVTEKQFIEAKQAVKKMYDKQISDIYAVQDPSLIRSKFAAFDPKRRKEADILAGSLAVPLADEDTRRSILEKLFEEKSK
jgi:hypothetical protein